MATVDIADATYERLKALAAARRLSLDAYLATVAERDGTAVTDSARQLRALESFSAGMTAWTSTHVPPGHVVDDSRERIYEGRGG